MEEKMTKSEVKLHNVADKLNPSATFQWHEALDRKRENNNIIMKASPVFMIDLQATGEQVFSGRDIVKMICRLKNISFKEEYLYFSNTPKKTEATAKANTTTTTKTPLFLEFVDYINKLEEQTGKRLSEIEILSQIINSQRPEAEKQEVLKQLDRFERQKPQQQPQKPSQVGF